MSEPDAIVIGVPRDLPQRLRLLAIKLMAGDAVDYSVLNKIVTEIDRAETAALSQRGRGAVRSVTLCDIEVAASQLPHTGSGCRILEAQQ